MCILEWPPRGANPKMKNDLKRERVSKVVAHQCKVGQQIDEVDPLKKPTGFMSNAPVLLKNSARRCFGHHGLCTRPQGGRHVECLGKKAQQAAIFQEELCMAILRDLKDQLLTYRRLRTGEASIVDAEGVMVDGNEEIEDYYYAGIIGNSATGTSTRPRPIQIGSTEQGDRWFVHLDCSKPS